MASKAKGTQGTLLQRGDGAGTEVFTTIAEVLSIKGPSETTAELEVTSMDSSQKEFISDLPDSGEVSFEMNFVGNSASQQGLRTDLRAGTVRNFKLILNDQQTTGKTTIAFSGIVKSLDLSADKGSAYKASASIKVSGQPTWTYTT